jgi:uncharacterized membrane protein
MNLARMFRHLFAEGSARRHFPPRVLDAIQQVVAAGELRHREQVCFAAEGALTLGALWREATPRQRAHDVFAHLRIWDTEHNSGVLIYVLLADHAIEIVADRGIAALVAESEWAAICKRMQMQFAAGRFEEGAVEGVTAVSDILARYFPADGTPRANELPDRPVLL